LDRDLKETEATESREKKTKLQTEVLQLVFAIYFRILKNSRHSPLLQPVLEGLAKFAHLISVDFFSDLMSVLHSLAETGGLTNKECMLCVLTAFEILSGQGESLTIDSRQFYVQLYGALLQLDTVSLNEDIVLAMECMDKMMRKRRQVSLQRVLGFVKRLSTVSLQLMPRACLAVLSTVRKCMLSYSQCDQLLDSDGVCGGVFRPEVADPEVCHAGSTLLWEYTVLSRHYSPAVKGYATHLLDGAPTQGRHALHPDIAKMTAGDLVSSSTQPLPPFPPPHPTNKTGVKNKEYYYQDAGIRDDVIRKAEQEAIKLAKIHNFD
jgi:nucleolar complex protein 3